MRRIFRDTTAIALGLGLTLPALASAQECRRSCRVDETRDANGCCVSAQSSATPPANLPRRCPRSAPKRGPGGSGRSPRWSRWA